MTLEQYEQLSARLELERALFGWHEGDRNPLDDAEPALRRAVLTRCRWHHAYEVWLRSSAWRAKRIAVLTRAGYRCERCGWGGGMFAATLLDVHHWRYDRLGDEPLSHLEALCADCHADADRERLGGQIAEAALA